MIVGVVGLGKVGSAMLARFAIDGYDVLGYDIRPDPLSTVSRYERGLLEAINEFDLKSRVVDLETLVEFSDLVFVIVPTPSTDRGNFSIEYVEDVVSKLSSLDYRGVVAISSTVNIGDTGYLKSKYPNLDLYYNPLYIRLGSVIRDLREVKFVMLGSRDGEKNDLLDQFWSHVSTGDRFWSKYEVVEATKLLLNSIMSLNIAVINKIGEIFDKIDGDIDYILRILELDRRFKLSRFRPGLGYGGPCLGRDNRCIAYNCKRLGVDPTLFLTIDYLNRVRVRELADRVDNYQTIGIYGLTYKRGYDSVEDSQAIDLARELIRRGKKVVLYDPILPQYSEVDSLEELEEKVDIILVTLPLGHPLDPKYLDIWR